MNDFTIEELKRISMIMSNHYLEYEDNLIAEKIQSMIESYDVKMKEQEYLDLLNTKSIKGYE